VTGPDEYNTVVDNNTYTNLMARENLRYAASTVDTLQERRPDLYRALVHKTRLDPAEVTEWKHAAEGMYIPYDAILGITPQDDQFLQQEPWDFAHTPPDKYPLLLFFHPLTIYRHQVIKQADLVLAMLLLGHEFSPELKKRNFDFYDPLTTGDSSLSPCIQSIMAAEVGDMKKAVDYARVAALMDLGDVAGNVKDGCHIAAMGGVWMIFVYGFAGMRDYDGRLSFRPRIPHSLERLRFQLMFNSQVLEIDASRPNTRYTLRTGSGLVITHEEYDIQLTPETPSCVQPNWTADTLHKPPKTSPH
jgi:alpha,alpha-trehalose phosphorylase